MFIHYCSVQYVFHWSPTCSVMTFMIYKTICLLQNKVYGSLSEYWQIKMMEMVELKTMTCKDQLIHVPCETLKRPICDRTQKVGCLLWLHIC